VHYKTEGTDASPATHFMSADAVVMTSGGSAFDQSDDGLMSEFAPHLRGMATSSGPQADGHGIKIAREVGVVCWCVGIKERE
jgi:hypothetical protein